MLNNMFSTWFNSWFSAWGDNEIKSVTKKEKYPWLNAEQIKRLEASVEGLTWSQKSIQLQKNYQAMIQYINEQNVNDNRVAVNNERFKNSLNKTDPRECKFDQSACRQTDLVNLVKEVKHLKASVDEDTVMKKLMQEMEVKGVSMDSLNDYLDKWDETYLYEMWLSEKPKKSKWKKIATWIWVGAWIIAWADVWLYIGWKTAEKIGEKIYEFPIDSSTQEAKRVNQAWTKIKDAEAEVKFAKDELNNAKKTWEWIEEAQEALDTAEKELKAAKWKKVVKVADTAREYNVWEWILEWWTAESRWIQASSKANQIFKRVIEPALEKSTETVNVQELINWLEDDIKDLAKNDPDKLAAYGDALEDLKASYKDPKFANYSMKDTQTLKSWLQGRTPQKYFKGKEITNELQELKGILSSKLTKAVHDGLNKVPEVWENAAKLYRDYANLKEYAWNMVKQSTNGWLKGWFWNFWSTAFHKATDGASAKVWLLLNKWWKWVAKATGVEKAADTIGDAWNYLVKNGKQFLKATKGKWLAVEDPVGIVQLLRLVPWTIWEVADQAAESPAVAVDDLLFEVQDFKDTWNSMSDEERIQNIKDQFKQAYGSELNDESAIKTYEKRKEKHPKGKYWLLDPINDVEIVMQA